ncbi:MAG: clan AA aspartic protease [Rhodospirillales bacterium]|nr:clan AA aspartic protease [Rhodospirillales bacterium]
MIRLLRTALALGSLALAGCVAMQGGGFRVGAACGIGRVGTVPVRAEDGLLLVAARIDGKPARLVLDTGAQRTLLTAEAVRRLGLPSDRHHGTATYGIGGHTSSFDAQVNHFTLAGIPINLPLVTVGRFQLAAMHGEADGMLGADVLGRFGIDLDATAGRMILYSNPGCHLEGPPWDGPAVALPGVRTGPNRLQLPIAVNGVQGFATLDTGAQTTAISMTLAIRAGATPGSLATDRFAIARGAAPGAVKVRLQQFQTLQVGPWLARDPVLPILPLPDGVGDGLIGEDFLLHRRVWLSFPASQMFVAAPAETKPLAFR